MKKMVFVLMLVVLLLSLTLPVAMAGLGVEDPCPPGYANNGNPKCWEVAPPGLQGNDNGNAGGNWVSLH
jgi:hypothetical protein